MNKIVCGIYCITNQINGKKYVGQSINIRKRWYEEKYKAKHQETVDLMPIYQALAKYGEENFLFEVLEECDAENLNTREQYWIDYYQSFSPLGYNILNPNSRVTKANHCSICGKVISYDATMCVECYGKQQRQIERPNKIELAKIVYEQGGFTQTARLFGVTDNAIRKWCKSYNLPTHTTDVKNWYRSEILNEPVKIKKEKTNKPIILQIDKQGNIIAEFKTPGEACTAVSGSKSSHITEVCNGKRKTAYGYVWKYKF